MYLIYFHDIYVFIIVYIVKCERQQLFSFHFTSVDFSRWKTTNLNLLRTIDNGFELVDQKTFRYTRLFREFRRSYEKKRRGGGRRPITKTRTSKWSAAPRSRTCRPEWVTASKNTSRTALGKNSFRMIRFSRTSCFFGNCDWNCFLEKKKKDEVE